MTQTTQHIETRRELCEARKALQVMILDPKIGAWLLKNDPQALRQAIMASTHATDNLAEITITRDLAEAYPIRDWYANHAILIQIGWNPGFDAYSIRCDADRIFDALALKERAGTLVNAVTGEIPRTAAWNR